MSYNKTQSILLEWDNEDLYCGITEDSAKALGSALFGVGKYTVLSLSGTLSSNSYDYTDANAVVESESKNGILFIKTNATGSNYAMISVIDGFVPRHYTTATLSTSYIPLVSPASYTSTSFYANYTKGVDDIVCISSSLINATWETYITKDFVISTDHSAKLHTFTKFIGDSNSVAHGNFWAPNKINYSSSKVAMIRGLIEDFSLETNGLYFVLGSQLLPAHSYFAIGNDVYKQCGCNSVNNVATCIKVGTLGESS